MPKGSAQKLFISGLLLANNAPLNKEGVLLPFGTTIEGIRFCSGCWNAAVHTVTGVKGYLAMVLTVPGNWPSHLISHSGRDYCAVSIFSLAVSKLSRSPAGPSASTSHT